jgi:hypothetical protein
MASTQTKKYTASHKFARIAPRKARLLRLWRSSFLMATQRVGVASSPSSAIARPSSSGELFMDLSNEYKAASLAFAEMKTSAIVPRAKGAL